jgi:hypothetical protein
VHVFTAIELAAGNGVPLTAEQNPSPDGPSITSQSGCGASPVYWVNWQISAVG